MDVQYCNEMSLFSKPHAHMYYLYGQIERTFHIKYAALSFNQIFVTISFSKPQTIVSTPKLNNLNSFVTQIKIFSLKFIKNSEFIFLLSNQTMVRLHAAQ